MEKEYKNNIDQEVNKPVATTQPAGELDCVVKKRTTGNKIFDILVYVPISWAGVSAASFVTAYQATMGKAKSFDWLRSTHQKLTGFLSSKVFSKLLHGSVPEHVESWSKGTALFAMLGAGGTLLTPIVKYLEDNRLKLSAKIDTALGTTPPDAALVQAEPKQNWLSVMSGRLASVGAAFAVFVAVGPKKLESMSQWFGSKATQGVVRIAPKANPQNVRKWADLAALDLLLTAITTGITYAFSRFVAKKTDDIPDDKQSAVIRKTPAAAAPEEQASPASSFAAEHRNQKKTIAPRQGNFSEHLAAMANNAQNAQAAL